MASAFLFAVMWVCWVWNRTEDCEKAYMRVQKGALVCTRFVAVLEIPPVVSAETAVRVQIVKDFKGKKK